MPNPIRIKRRASSGAAGISGVTALHGELLYNENDDILYYGFGDSGIGGLASSIKSIGGPGVNSTFVTLADSQTISGNKIFSGTVEFTNTAITFPTGFTLPINRGGTGSSTASTARIALGLEIGVDVNSWDADLDAIAALIGTSGILKKTAADTWALDTTAYGTGTVTSVTGTAPVVSSGGNTPDISMAAATSSVDGYMTSAQVTKLDGIATGAQTGTVTSITVIVDSSIQTVSGSPVTTSGTIDISLNTQGANKVWSGPETGSSFAPTFRYLVVDDIPTLIASKISDFDTQVRTSGLDEMDVPVMAVSFNNQKIIDLADPTSPQDAATKSYVDAASQGLSVKASARIASTVSIAIATALIHGSEIDGVTVATNDRVLLKNQTTGSENGIYVVVESGEASRSIDANVSAEVVSGVFIFIEEGTLNGGKGYVLTTSNPITLNTTSLTFTQFSSAGDIVAGDGLIQTGNIIDVVGTAARISVSVDAIDIDSDYVGQSSITTLGTIGTGEWKATKISLIYGGTNTDLSNTSDGTIFKKISSGLVPADLHIDYLSSDSVIDGGTF